MELPGLPFAPTPRQSGQLVDYAQLLRQWNPRINLVAPSTLAGLEQRHILDSAQLVPHLPRRPAQVADVGSGAGLPGLILAVLAPQHRFTLVERDQRKSAFLRTAAHRLGLANVAVAAEDVRRLPGPFGVVTARAWAELKDIVALTGPLLAPGGCWLLLKGQALDAELRACETAFHLTTARWPSIVAGKDGERGWVVHITRRGEAGPPPAVELSPSSTGNA